MPVKSSITTPADQDRVVLGPLTIRGFAWAGEQKVMRVDVSTDGGSRWSPAELTPQNLNFAWRLWSYRWTPPRPGFYTILSRATDSTGRVHPIVAEGNPSGDLVNRAHPVGTIDEKSA